MNEYAAWAITLPLAYLIGSVPSGLIVAKLVKGVDIRSYGSGSTGATNVLRTLGPRAGALVLAIDMAKGAGAAAIAKWGLLPNSDLALALAGTLAVVGHTWPIFARFRGGKGVATGLGVLFVLWWPVGLTAFAGAIIARITGFVSIGSLMGTVAGLTFLAVLIAVGRFPIEYLWFAIPVTALIFARHAANIKRLIKGTESRLDTKPKKARAAGAKHT